MKNINKVFLFSLFFGLFACKNSISPVVNVKTPNIILIVVDDQGYADFSPFENHDVTAQTPNMGSLAASGMVFTQAYTTAPVCSPSRVAILTGKNQIRWDKQASWGPGLPESVKTIPEYLKEVGYATAKIGKNDLGRNFHKYNFREYPLKHGFDEFLGFNAHAHDYWLLSQDIKDKTPDPSGTSAALGPLMHNNGVKSYNEGYLTAILTDEAINYVKKQKKDKPFFLTLSYNAVHHLIHEVPQKYLNKFNVKPIANYDPDSLVTFGKHPAGSYSAYYDKYSRLGAIQDEDLRKYYLANLNCLDDNIGRFLETIKKEGIEKETIIIFVSDNGGEPSTGANNRPLTAGKFSLWEGGIRVPMSISWPGKIAAGQVQKSYVSAMDILPTIALAAGITLTDPTIDGVNLLKPIKDRMLVWKWQKAWAIRIGDYKLTNTNEDHWKGRPSDLYIKPIRNDYTLKLFNLTIDPGERNDLSSKNPEKVKELETAYLNWCATNIGNF